MMMMMTVMIFHMIWCTESVEWPGEDEYCPPDDAKDLILGLLQHNPLERLGTIGVHQVKEHVFFEGLDWDGLLRQKAEFIPHLQNEEDTSYFDSKWKLSHSVLFFLYFAIATALDSRGIFWTEDNQNCSVLYCVLQLHASVW